MQIIKKKGIITTCKKHQDEMLEIEDQHARTKENQTIIQTKYLYIN